MAEVTLRFTPGDEYRARMVPLIKTGLAIPRAHVEELRKEAEAVALIDQAAQASSTAMPLSSDGMAEMPPPSAASLCPNTATSPC